jgi:hypothetical protein
MSGTPLNQAVITTDGSAAGTRLTINGVEVANLHDVGMSAYFDRDYGPSISFWYSVRSLDVGPGELEKVEHFHLVPRQGAAEASASLKHARFEPPAAVVTEAKAFVATPQTPLYIRSMASHLADGHAQNIQDMVLLSDYLSKNTRCALASASCQAWVGGVIKVLQAAHASLADTRTELATLTPGTPAKK